VLEVSFGLLSHDGLDLVTFMALLIIRYFLVAVFALTLFDLLAQETLFWIIQTLWQQFSIFDQG
jgi:hypothetical protein